MKFNECLGIESESYEFIKPYLDYFSKGGTWIVVRTGRFANLIQPLGIDIVMQQPGREPISIEVKSERSNLYGNIFFETWSNLSYGRQKLGCLVTTNADYLWYVFIDSNEVYSVPMKALWDWAFVQGKIYAFPEKTQVQHSQKNVTAGRTIPIATLRAEVKNFKAIHELRSAA